METDIGKLYLNLNELLGDICKFLSSEKLGNLSNKDKILVDSLIIRSKMQLQEISKIQQLPTNEEYVDMDRKQDDNNAANTETTLIEEGTVYPYKDLPAKEASQDTKYGFMSMKRKFLLGFEKMKRVYAAIHNQWLLIYFSDKDGKPICTFDLTNYEAKEADGDRNTNFELTSSTSPDRKTYYFMALTRKDMLQWVVHINRCHDAVVLRNKGINIREKRKSTNHDDDSGEYYDSIRLQSEMEDNEDDIYLELDDMVKPNSQNNNTIIRQKIPEEKPEPKPPLPGRRPLRINLSIPVAPPVVKPLPSSKNNSDESLVSYDDIENKEKDSNKSHNVSTQSFKNSSSDEDDEDTTYEAFVEVKGVVNRLQNKNQESQKIETKNTDTDGKTNPQESSKVPVLPLKPKVKDKPTVAKKPLVFFKSTSNS